MKKSFTADSGSYPVPFPVCHRFCGHGSEVEAVVKKPLPEMCLSGFMRHCFLKNQSEN